MSYAPAFSMQLDLPEASAGPQETINEYFISCLNGETKKVVELLTNNPLLRLQKKTDKNGKTGLMLTAGNGYIETLNKILPFHMNTEKEIRDTRKNQTAREWAEYHDWEECFNLLEENK